MKTREVYYTLARCSMKDAVIKIMSDQPEVSAQEIADCFEANISTIRNYMSLNRKGKLENSAMYFEQQEYTFFDEEDATIHDMEDLCEYMEEL